MSKSAGDNGYQGGTALGRLSVGILDDLRAIDSLPKPIRVVLREAPYAYHGPAAVEMVAQLMRRGLTAHQVAAILKAEINRHIALNARACYGDAHPQARISL